MCSRDANMPPWAAFLLTILVLVKRSCHYLISNALFLKSPMSYTLDLFPMRPLRRREVG